MPDWSYIKQSMWICCNSNYLPSCCLLSFPVSTRGPPTSTSAPAGPGLGLSGWTGLPEAMASCLARRRCKSSFSASPWHRSDSSLTKKNFWYVKEYSRIIGKKKISTEHILVMFYRVTLLKQMGPYEVELTRCTTLCLYVRHCSTKSTITSCLSPCRLKSNLRKVKTCNGS